MYSPNLSLVFPPFGFPFHGYCRFLSGVFFLGFFLGFFSFLFCRFFVLQRFSSERDTHGRFPKICSTSSEKNTSREINTSASWACLSAFSFRIFLALSYCSRYDFADFFIDEFSRVFAIRFGKSIFLPCGIIIRKIR